MKYVIISMLAAGCLFAGCNGGGSGHGAPVTSSVSTVSTDVFTKIAWAPTAGDSGVTIQERGFGLGPNGEFVFAGGFEDRSLTDQPRFVLHDDVSFFSTVAATGSLTLLGTATLPKALAAPNVVTVAGVMYVLGGYEPTTVWPISNAKVWRYDPSGNAFIAEADDPEPDAGSYAFAFNGSLYRVTPPYQPHQNPVHLGSVARLQPGGAWISKPLSAEIPVEAAWTVFSGKLYVFGGLLRSTAFSTTTPENTSVYSVDLDTGVVSRLAVQTRARTVGSAFVASNGSEVVLAGGDDAWNSSREAWPESFDGLTVRDRYDLQTRYALRHMVVSGTYVFAYDPYSLTFAVFRFNL